MSSSSELELASLQTVANRDTPLLDPEGLLVFAAIARAQGVRGAAQALGKPRSTVSRRLADLEAAIGAPLVIRTTRRFALTELGTALFARCEKLEELLRSSEELILHAKSEPSGTLRIAVAPVLGEEILPSLLDAIVQTHPLLHVDARLAVDYVDLRSGQVDVALRTGPLEDAADLFAVRLGLSITGVYASAAYLDRQGTPNHPADLADHECILVGSGPRIWSFLIDQSEQSFAVSGRLRVDNFRVARALATRGAGLVRLARMFADPVVRAGELVPLLERYWVERPIFAVHNGPNPPSPKVRAFIDLARDAVRRALA